MKVCEVDGRIIGLEYDTDTGLLLQGVVPYLESFCYREQEIKFPFNVNPTKVINLDKIMNKKFKITVEVIEED